MIYINMGFKRLSPDEKRKVAPFLFESIKVFEVYKALSYIKMIKCFFPFSKQNAYIFIKFINYKQNVIALKMGF